MKNFVKPGKTLTLNAPYNVTSGQGLQVGSLFGVANTDALSGVDTEADVQGVFTLAKATGAAWTQGVKLYWDNTAKNVTTTVSTNLFIGHAAGAQLSADVVGNVRLHGCPQ